MNIKAEDFCQINGPVIGGNLTLLCNLLGTKLTPKIKHKILILEDINEKGYQIHRNLVHLYNSKIFSNVSAVIFGDFNGKDRLITPAIEDFIKNYLDVPVFCLNNFGHGKINNPVILGWSSYIKDKQLICQSPFRMI